MFRSGRERHRASLHAPLPVSLCVTDVAVPGEFLKDPSVPGPSLTVWLIVPGSSRWPRCGMQEGVQPALSLSSHQLLPIPPVLGSEDYWEPALAASHWADITKALSCLLLRAPPLEHNYCLK